MFDLLIPVFFLNLKENIFCHENFYFMDLTFKHGPNIKMYDKKKSNSTIKNLYEVF